MLRRLTELCARRACEYSDMVARLGTYHNNVQPGIVDLLIEIRRRRCLCEEAEEELARYLDEATNGLPAPCDFRRSAEM